jgi:Putative amidoligase enzyme
MLSPLFVAYPDSPWRNYVQATWKALQDSYEITGDQFCGTHIHISVEGGYSFQELKRIAQSVIHFEPALDALVPAHRLTPHNEFAMSNWLDSKSFAYKNRTRAESIKFIAGMTDFYTFLQVMNPEGERRYGFNFRSIDKYYTIEFRKPPASRSAEECLRWAELALSFIQSAIQFGSPERLEKVPQTVGGLRWFLEKSHVPDLNEHDRLKWFWRRTKENEFVESAPMAFHLTPVQEGKMNRLRKEEGRRIAAFAQRAKAPYWTD